MLVWRPQDERNGLSERRQALVLCEAAGAVVRRLARRFARHRQDLPDYEMAGMTGLVTAAVRFDFERPLTRATVEDTFAAWAYVYVVREMAALAGQDQVAPVHAREYVARLTRQGRDTLAEAITLEDEEQAETLGMRPEEVRRQRLMIAGGAARIAPLDPERMERTAHAPSAEEEAFSALVSDEVRAAVEELPERERIAVSMVLDGQSRAAIASRLGVTERSIKNYLRAARERLSVSLAHLA